MTLLRGHAADPLDPPDGRMAIPWLSIVVITVLIFLADHSLKAPLDYRATTDSVMEAVQLIGEGSAKRQLAYTCMALFGVLALVWRPRWRLRIRGPLAWCILAFLSWSFLSFVWSSDHSLTIRRLAVLAFVCTGALGLLRQFRREHIVLLIMFATLSFVIVGFVNEVALGTFTPVAGGYRFGGTLHPVEQSLNCSLLIMSAVCLATREKEYRRVYIACIGIGLVFLFLTRSRTGTAAMLGALFVYWMLIAYRFRMRTITLVLLSGGVLLVVLLLMANDVIPVPWDVLLMGRGTKNAATLTGRIPLWELLFRFGMERPFLGYGYNSFMSPGNAMRVAAVIAFGLNSAHSIYLDTFLGLGAVGFGLLVLLFVTALVRGIRVFGVHRDPALAFFAVLIVFEMLSGLLDSTLLFPGPRLLTFIVLGYLAFRDTTEENVVVDAIPIEEGVRYGAAWAGAGAARRVSGAAMARARR
jgi:exopolysaccharide production protein ExoQ